MIMPQLRNWKPEFLEGTRFEVLHEYVGAREHGTEQGLVNVFRQIEDD